MANPIVNIFNALGSWLDDFARLIRNGRSSDALLDETISSMHEAFGQSYEATKDAAGHIEISLNGLAQAKSAAKTAHANVNRAVRDAQSLTGQELQIQQAKIVGLSKIATNTDEVILAMEATIERARKTQNIVEGRVAVEATNMQLRETTARMNVAMEKLFGSMELVDDSQLRAAGYMNDNKRIKDHTSELGRRAARAQGRADSAGRMVEQIVGNPFANSLSNDEQEILAAAYQAAGKTLPESQTQAEKSAS